MRYELSDYEWAAIKPMLPNKPERRVRRKEISVILLRMQMLWGVELAVPVTARRVELQRAEKCCCYGSSGLSPSLRSVSRLPMQDGEFRPYI